MDWRRGLIRVWIVISFLYGAVFLAVTGPDAVSNFKTIAAPEKVDANPRLESTKEAIDKFDRELARRKLRRFAVAAVVPPAVFWAFLYAGFWISGGFKSGGKR